MCYANEGSLLCGVATLEMVLPVGCNLITGVGCCLHTLMSAPLLAWLLKLKHNVCDSFLTLTPPPPHHPHLPPPTTPHLLLLLLLLPLLPLLPLLTRLSPAVRSPSMTRRLPSSRRWPPKESSCSPPGLQQSWNW